MGIFYKVRMSEVSGTLIASAYSDSHSSKVTGAQESQRTRRNWGREHYFSIPRHTHTDFKYRLFTNCVPSYTSLKQLLESSK